MKKQILAGLIKLIIAVAIFVSSFAGEGAQRALSIWLGSVISLPVFLWGVLDFVKIAKKDNEDDEQ